MPLGYDVKEEASEITTELKNSRGSIIVGIISFVGGAIIASKLTRNGSITDNIKSWLS